MADVGSVSEIDLFKNLPNSCLELLEDHSRIMEFGAGHLFFSHGQAGESLFFLESGSVRTFLLNHGKKLNISMLGSPAVFGEMGCFGKGTHLFSAETVRASRVRVISRDTIECVLECAPHLALGFIDLMNERFSRLLREFELHSPKATIPRLATLLLEKTHEGVVRGLTHKDLASEMGIHRETVTTALGELRTAGIIAIERKTIRVLQRERLERAGRE